MANNALIEQAIDDLISQDAPNVRETARKYDLVHSTLLRRYNGRTVSTAEALSQKRQLLTDAQEEVIIKYLNKLSDRGFHPTPQILENVVVEVVGHPIGGNWIQRFYKRHSGQITSIYLRCIDQKRIVADNEKHFTHYFKTVSTQWLRLLRMASISRPTDLYVYSSSTTLITIRYRLKTSITSIKRAF